MSNRLPILPSWRNPTPPSAELFTPGTLVALRNCPGPSGTVQGMRRGKVIVRWADLNYTGKHAPDALVLVAELNQYEERPK